MTRIRNDRPQPAERVLFVDDDPMVRVATERMLRRRFDVVAAPSGEAALELVAREGPFAVVVTDQCMGGMDGITLLSHLRRVAPDTVGVLLSGGPEAWSGARSDVDVLLEKPCPADRLYDVVSRGIESFRRAHGARTETAT